jgi:rsbT co-antagonist protein RsbR
MDTAHTYVTEARRQLIRLIARALTIGGGAVIGFVLVMIFVLPDGRQLWLYPMMLGLVVAGSVSTLQLTGRLPLGQAMLPLAAALIGGVLVSALVLRETTLSAVPFLAVVVLLITLGQSRRTTVVVGAICILLAVVLAWTAPQPVLGASEISLGLALPLVYAASAVAVIAVMWLITQRLLDISDAAIALADQRADEALLAQSQAERQTHELAEQNDAQQKLLSLVATLETPVVILADEVVLLPIIGHVDSRRAQDLTTRLLDSVHRQRVRLVILDISGIAMMDSGVAQRLVQTAQAVRLLGAQVILCGVRAETATTLVELGVDLEGIQTVRTPHEALERLVTAQPLRHGL